MPIGINPYICPRCGKEDTSTECILTSCPDPECEQKYQAYHPGDQCPCLECVAAKKGRLRKGQEPEDTKQ